MGQMFGELVNAMSESDTDILGDLFQGAITYGEAGQYFTPEPVTKLLAQMTIDPDARPENGRPILVNDPCCGTGRMLLEAAAINSHVELVGQDIDARCTMITAINLGLRGRYGWVLCGNSLSGEMKFAYRIGSFYHETPNGLRRGVIRDVPPEHTPVPVLAGHTREQVQSLFASETRPADTDTAPVLTVIEVPRWLARLEPALEATEGDKPVAPQPAPEQPTPEPNDGPPRQQTLF